MKTLIFRFSISFIINFFRLDISDNQEKTELCQTKTPSSHEAKQLKILPAACRVTTFIQICEQQTRLKAISDAGSA